MNVYRYCAPTRHGEVFPDADAIMDALAEHALEQKSVEDALRKLCKHGMAPKYEPPLEGLDEYASRLRELRKQLLNQYTMDPLVNKLSREIQSLVRRELEAIQKDSNARQGQLNRRAESFLRKSADMLRKMEEMKAGSRHSSPQSLAGLEKTFEDLFLKKYELETEFHELRSQEAQRLSLLKRLPNSPTEALKALEGYQPVDPSVGESLASLKLSADKIASIEKVALGPGFCGDRPVTLDEAFDLVNLTSGMQRLETKLRRGAITVSEASRLEEILGSDANICSSMAAHIREKLLRAGYLEQGDDGLRLAPRAIRRIGQKALAEIFANLGRDHFGRHKTGFQGAGTPDIADTKAHGFGDSFNIHLGKTLMNALLRDASRIPIDINPADFEVYSEQRTTDCANALLLDLSYTMAHNGKLQTAKKVVFALESLIRTRFPDDTLHIVGFATHAEKLRVEDLPGVNITIGNPFTNMQDGLRLAEQLISRDRGRNRQIILITDGEPTAFCRDGDVYMDYPPTPEIFLETIKEVARLTRKGIVINTFMLDDQPLLVDFVKQMTKINKGRAFFSTPDRLGEYVLVDYLAHRRRFIN